MNIKSIPTKASGFNGKQMVI